MGKRIIQQRRGHGSNVYKVKNKAFGIVPKYLANLEGEWSVVNLISTPGHSAPLAKFANSSGKVFNNFASNNLFVGQKIKFGGNSPGDINILGNIKTGTEIFNIEKIPGDGGKFIRSGGNFGILIDRQKDTVKVLMPSKKEKIFNINCRATIGRLAGGGRIDKPILKAGKKFHIMRAKSKLWPKTSAVSMNAIDHPFGSGRGKRIKSKISKRYSAPGKKVGHLRPRRTGRKKR